MFPEWKEKRTSTQNAAIFHKYLEKKNYDSQHHFRGKANNPAFAQRIEYFLSEVEKRGLDWRKCMRKLKRRCCDLLRYGKTDPNSLPIVDTPMSGHEYLSLIGYIAQQSLDQMKRKESSSSGTTV